jgi:TIR domain-containing protein
MSTRVFISYTREKDKFAAVSEFRDRIEAELRFYDPEAVVFQDRQFIQGGHHFPEKLAEECRKADVLMLYITPSWLQSEWCRREFEIFTAYLQEARRMAKILPMLTVDTPQVSAASTDPIARHLASVQHIDIRELRHLRYDNPAKLRYVADVAKRLYELAQR